MGELFILMAGNGAFDDRGDQERPSAEVVSDRKAKILKGVVVVAVIRVLRVHMEWARRFELFNTDMLMLCLAEGPRAVLHRLPLEDSAP